MKVLVFYSDPPPDRFLRLDREDKLITALSKRFSESVTIERMHASEVEDVHSIIVNSSFDVIQFSGHGNSEGIVLDKSDIEPGGELVSAERLQSLVAIAEKPPLLVILLSCYSNASLPILVDIAPFVITAVGPVNDRACLEFVQGLYERLFGGYSIQSSFDHALNLLKSKALPSDNFRLDRRSLIEREGSKFVESTPDIKRNSILVNLDAVSDQLTLFGMPEEELLHLLARKLSIHYWIFDVPRERCLIPIGRLLFGEFNWEDATDVVHCSRLLKLQADVPSRHWEVWHKLLISYNDLASNEYRALGNLNSPSNKQAICRAAQRFQHYIQKYLLPAKTDLEDLGYSEWIPHIGFIASHCEMASDHLSFEQIPLAVKNLEEALTNYHELVEGLRPPEENIQARPVSA